MTKTALTELDEYIFTRPETAKLLGISTNALRMRMRKGTCELDFRWDGRQFKFKRPGKDPVNTRVADHSQTTHKKVINRGATHKGQGNYSSGAFKRHNEMKIMNSINGKFKSEAHRKEFEKLNEEALKQADENVKKEENRAIQSQFKNPNKYGGMLTAKGIKSQDDQLQDRLNRSHYKVNTGDTYWGPKTFFGNFGQKAEQEKDAVEIDPRHFTPDDREPEFSSKVEESIWRIKNNK